ncbi:MAG: hypothetical protein AB7F65_02685 [Dehalococcoidia bacterium]
MPRSLKLLHPRWAAMLALVALLATIIACDDDGDTPTSDAGEDLPTNALEITVGPEGINPPREQVRVPDRYQLIVNNSSDEACSFYLGAFVRDLEVGPGETGQIDVQLPPSGGDDEQIEMGCLGDETRQGTLVVRNATGSDLGVD